ncbi:MAG: VOC family protein [Flavobacteriaceae bacterium]|nr:VOC family protein [Flavobacteriaceae bacterium]
MQNTIHWVEIPTENIERAVVFYNQLLSIEMKVMEAMGMKTAFFPHTAENQSGACLMQGPHYTPSAEGTIIYLSTGEDLQTSLDKIEGIGGAVVLPKTALGPNGFMAHIMDTEGNKIGLHAKA